MRFHSFPLLSLLSPSHSCLPQWLCVVSVGVLYRPNQPSMLPVDCGTRYIPPHPFLPYSSLSGSLPLSWLYSYHSWGWAVCPRSRWKCMSSWGIVSTVVTTNYGDPLRRQRTSLTHCVESVSSIEVPSSVTVFHPPLPSPSPSFSQAAIVVSSLLDTWRLMVECGTPTALCVPSVNWWVHLPFFPFQMVVYCRKWLIRMYTMRMVVLFTRYASSIEQWRLP